LKGPLHFAVIFSFFILLSFLVPAPFLLSRGYCQNKKHILVLHSYNQGLDWTDNENKGITSILKPRSRNIEVYTEYMDTKRFPGDQRNRTFADLLKRKYASIHFNAIICSDDNAFNFLLKYHNGLFPGVPIVFCGVNYFRDAQLKGNRDLITGVVESFDIADTLRTALRLQPDISTVVVINDKTTTGRANRKVLDGVIPEFKSRVGFVFLDDLDMGDLLKKVRALQPGTIILLLSFNRDHSGQVFDYNQSINLISHAANVPIYGVWDFYLGKGIVGGMLTSGKSQGRLAAQMALRILNGEPVRDMPVVKESPNRYMFDYRQLKRFGIDAADLPKGSIVINRPASFYRLHPQFVWGAGGSFAGLLTIILFLLIHLRERKRAEYALMKSEEELKRAHLRVVNTLESIADGFVAFDSQWRFIYVNTEAERILGIRRHDLVGKNHWAVFPFTVGTVIDRACQQVMETREPADFEYHHQEKDRWHNSWTHYKVYPMEDGGISVYFRDISDSKKGEMERIRLAAAVEQLTEAVLITDTNWIINYVNPAFERMSGYRRDEIIGQHARVLKDDNQADASYREIRETLLRGAVWSGCTINKKKDGAAYDAEVTASPILDNSGAIINYVTIRRDITQERRLQRRLRQSQKMEAIGTLAGGIAHDFNNILSAIIGYAQLARYKVIEENPVRHDLDAVLKAASRATELVKQILSFSRQTDPVKKPVDVAACIEEALKLLRPSLPTTIRIYSETSIPPERATVLADPTEIQQVLMNLCTNASHAMRARGGILSVNLSEMVADTFFLSRHPDLKMGSYVCLTISDTGHGMDAAVMERIFDPYFTTKRLGKGTGLGLAVVQGIVENYGGTVTVYSEPEKGTTSAIFLPSSDAKITAPAVAAAALPNGTEHILFVDDEKTLVELGQKMLTSLGYSVSIKTSSLDALDVFRADPPAFDLVITDMTMPGLTGSELAKELMAIRPDLPVILCTGFSELINRQKAKDAGIREFVMKPYDVSTMAKAIRKALAEK
jgi:two-component system, cell cycle sensor histidine kinase and response regulator CckA